MQWYSNGLYGSSALWLLVIESFASFNICCETQTLLADEQFQTPSSDSTFSVVIMIRGLADESLLLTFTLSSNFHIFYTFTFTASDLQNEGSFLFLWLIIGTFAHA